SGRGFAQGAGVPHMTDDQKEASKANEAVSDSGATVTAVAESGHKTSALPEAEIARMTDDIIAALKTVFDPEIPADIYELGLIYKVDIEDDRSVKVEMTLTTPNCPSAAELPIMVETAVASVPGVSGAKVDIVWDPPW